MSQRRVLPADDAEVTRLLRDGWQVVAKSWGVGLHPDDFDCERLRALSDALDRRFEIRRLGNADVPAVVALDEQIADDFPGDVATRRTAMSADEARPTERRWAWGSFMGDELVGMVYADLGHGSDAEIDFFGVAARWRGRGIGTALLATAVAKLVDVGHAKLRTGVAAENAPSIAALEAVGLQRDEEWLTLAPPTP